MCVCIYPQVIRNNSREMKPYTVFRFLYMALAIDRVDGHGHSNEYKAV